jgi:hypothetical protein
MGSPEVNILEKEIDSWKGFEYALCQPTECLENKEYAAAFKSKGPQDSAESLLISFNIPAAENDN